MKQHVVTMLDKTIHVELSKSAVVQLENMNEPLRVEMELYFSCLLRKRVYVRESHITNFTSVVNDKLELGFRPVMTRACSVASCDGEEPPVGDFPIKKPETYIPHWLKLDYRKGGWVGEFGYNSNAEPAIPG